jgi:Tfp pilus assembly protein PilV
MKNRQGFILMTVLIVVFALSTLGLLRMVLSASRTADVMRYTTDLQLLYLAESGISRAQANAADPAKFYSVCDLEYFLGNGSYIIQGNVGGTFKTVTVNSYIPNFAEKKQWKTLVIEGESITSNYSWREVLK